MNIDELTIAQAKSLAAMFGNQPGKSSTAFDVGENYLIRTVTHIQTGRVFSVSDQEIVLEDAAWIADTGRFAGALLTAEFSEVEPFPAGRRVIVGRGALIDAVRIPTLPTVQK